VGKMGKLLRRWKIEGLLKKYETPLLIWAHSSTRKG